MKHRNSGWHGYFNVYLFQQYIDVCHISLKWDNFSYFSKYIYLSNEMFVLSKIARSFIMIELYSVKENAHFLFVCNLKISGASLA